MSQTRYNATSAATRKNRPLHTGFETETEAREHAVFLAENYGGVAKVNTNNADAPVIAKYSAKRGSH